MTIINCDSRADALAVMKRLREQGIVCELTGSQLKVLGDVR